MDNRGSVNNLFLQHLGRAGTPEELDYLTRFINEGHLNPAEVGNYLQSIPEYQQGQLTRDTAAYGAELDKGTAPVLDQAAARINSQFAGQGRPISSAQGGALAQVAQNLAMNKQSALADFYGKGITMNRSAMVGMGKDAINRGYGLRDEARQRQYQIEDYYREQNDYNTAQNSNNKIFGNPLIGKVTNGVLNLGASYLGGRAAGAGQAAGYKAGMQ